MIEEVVITGTSTEPLLKMKAWDILDTGMTESGPRAVPQGSRFVLRTFFVQDNLTYTLKLTIGDHLPWEKAK
jgi:hypothetical protein